jgi:hypothetical protein
MEPKQVNMAFVEQLEHEHARRVKEHPEESKQVEACADAFVNTFVAMGKTWNCNQGRHVRMPKGVCLFCGKGVP